VERVKTFFDLFSTVGKTCGFTGENGENEAKKRRLGTGKGREKEGLRNATLDCKVREMKAEQWTKAKSLYLAGKTWKAIASETGLNQATLLSKASREGLPKVRKELRNTVSSKETVSLESLSALVRSKLAADAASTLERIDSYSLEGIKDEATRETILGSVAKRSALVFGWSEQGEQASVSINLLGSMPDRTPAEVVVSEPPKE
jgi:hypothetical protein